MAGVPAGLPAGVRVSDHISLGVIAKTFPPDRVQQVLAETGQASERERDLPAQVMVYYGRWCTRWMKVEMSPAPVRYATTRWQRADFGRPVSSIRFRTVTPMVASACWAAKPRARSRGPISAL